MDRVATGSRSWVARPFLSRVLRFLIFVVPIAVSVAVAAVAAALLPRPASPMEMVVWWVVFLFALTVPAAVCTRLARRLLPMVALLKLTLVFPDKAPSRLEVAKQAGRTRDLKERVRQQEDADDPDEAAAVVLALITALGDHDRLTRGHSERVRAFTDMLAEKVGIVREDREKLRWAALLHDVGKLEVASTILNKPGRPSEEEWSILQRHPEKGVTILGPLAAWLGPWCGAVSDHHEKFDGTGYPRGLEGVSISLGGRILAIADSYEVMTAARPYKKPMTAEAARTELTRCAGSHFDPRLVRDFLEVSVGRLWIAIGLGAVLAQLPILSGLSYRGLTERFGRSVATAAGVVGSTAVLALGGAIDVPDPQVTGPIFIAETGDNDAESIEGPTRPGVPKPGESPGVRGGGQGDEESPEATGAPGGSGPVDSTSIDAPETSRPSDEPGEPQRPARPQEVVKEGEILAGAPLDPTVPGLTESEFLAACATPSSQGTDAWVFRLPTEGEVDSATVTAEPSAGGDSANLHVYDDGCEPLGSRFVGRSTAFPSGAAWVVVVPTRGLATHVILRASIR